MLNILVSILIFAIVFALHLGYFRVVTFGCSGESAGWFTSYLKLQEYYLGFAYAISLAFAVFAFMKFKDNRKKAIEIGAGASAWAIGLWILGCFLVGCCGSPMWIVYINIFGISILKVPKWSIAVISLAMVLLGYLWLKRKLPKSHSKDNSKEYAG